MKLFSTDIIREWDTYTIQKHYEDSSELMEIAAHSAVVKLKELATEADYFIFCGTGNNGGDGLCIARLLNDESFSSHVFIVGDSESGTKDFKLNLKRLLDTDVPVNFLSEANFEFQLPSSGIVIDCIFGTGINRPAEGWMAKLIDKLNALPLMRIAIDLPSGLIPDLIDMQQGSIFRANHTLTFQTPKRAFLFPENYDYVGDFEVLSIGLDEEFPLSQECELFYYNRQDALSDYKERSKFSYKNNFGHVRIVAGSKGKMGAAVLSSIAAMRSGAGLVTASVPACGLDVMQISNPEVMCEADSSTDVLSGLLYDASYSATGIGSGLGQAPETSLMLRRMLKEADKPLVLDADALNIIAAKKLFHDIPKGSILTPHVGEFDRLFGSHDYSFARFRTAKLKAVELQLNIVLKGAHTLVATPQGELYFNSTGNVGMASAGSGDVLTGVITSLLGQGYRPEVAARLGVFLHGVSGDIAASALSYEGMIARDLVHLLPSAFDVLTVGDFPL